MYGLKISHHHNHNHNNNIIIVLIFIIIIIIITIIRSYAERYGAQLEQSDGAQTATSGFIPKSRIQKEFWLTVVGLGV